jgi:hypothetical protein
MEASEKTRAAKALTLGAVLGAVIALLARARSSRGRP